MKRLAAGAAILLAACSQQGAKQVDGNANMTPVPAASPAAPESTPAATATASPSPSPSIAPGEARLPPAGATQARYIGRWATTQQLCASGAWRFYATHLETAGEVSCSYNRVDKVPGGYDLHASCTAEAPPEPDVIKLRFAESAQAMLVDSKTLKSVGLIYCGGLK